MVEYLLTHWIKNDWLFVNGYSIVHLLTGILIVLLIVKIWQRIYKKRTFDNVENLLFIMLIISIGWEVFEVTVDKYYPLFFHLDGLVDTCWDIIFEMVGGIIGIIIWWRRK